MKRGGTGSAFAGCVDVDFNAVASASFGVVVQVKICEMCGKNFLRAGGQRDCASCVAEQNAPKKPVPPKADWNRDRTPREKFAGLTGLMAQAWREWEEERAAEAECLVPATKAKGPRFVLTAQERARRHSEIVQRYRRRKREMAKAASTTIQ